MLSMKNKDLSKKDKSKMSDVLEAHQLFIQAFPEHRFGSVKEMLNAAHRFISPRVAKPFTHRRVRTIWEKKARRINAEEKDALREAVIEEHKREHRQLRARLAYLSETLAVLDEEPRSAPLGASGRQTHQMGGVHRDREVG